MGLDGGTIPTRGELVQVKKKPEQKDKQSDIQHKWSNCTITQLPLEIPIVLCHLGMLFNKSTILEFLLGKLKLEKCVNFQHIESMRDVCQLNLTINRFKSERGSAFVCPVTGLEMNGKHRFVCLWECGCVVSERAMKEAPSTSCYKCGEGYTKNDIVHINPSDEDFEIMRIRMAQRKTTRKPTVHNKKSYTETVKPDTNTDLDSAREPKGSIPSSSTVAVSSTSNSTSKREHNSEPGTHSHKSKKRKKEHKNKKSKRDKNKIQSAVGSRPQLHSGWADILSTRR